MEISQPPLTRNTGATSGNEISPIHTNIVRFRMRGSDARVLCASRYSESHDCRRDFNANHLNANRILIGGRGVVQFIPATVRNVRPEKVGVQEGNRTPWAPWIQPWESPSWEDSTPTTVDSSECVVPLLDQCLPRQNVRHSIHNGRVCSTLTQKSHASDCSTNCPDSQSVVQTG